jgi:hypothetical protein
MRKIYIYDQVISLQCSMTLLPQNRYKVMSSPEKENIQSGKDLIAVGQRAMG